MRLGYNTNGWAHHDPFVALAPFMDARLPPCVLIDVVAQGGHMGFLGGDGQGGIRWAETRVVRWVLEQVSCCQSTWPPR